MSRLIAIVIINIFSSFIMVAQNPVFLLDTTAVCKGEEVSVVMTVQNFTDMTSFQFTVNWDSTLLTYSEVLFLDEVVTNSIINENAVSSGLLGFSWLSPSIMGTTIPDNDQVYEIVFVVNDTTGGNAVLPFSSDLVFIEASVYQPNGPMQVPMDTAAGSVLISASMVISVLIEDETDNNMNGSIDLSLTGGFEPYNFEWNSGQQMEDIDNLTAGTYICSVTNALGCLEVLGPFEVDQLSNDENVKTLLRLDIFPNPVIDLLTVNLDFTTIQKGSIQINNLIGTNQFESYFEGNSVQRNINVKSFGAGLYFLKIKTKDEVLIFSFVKL